MKRIRLAQWSGSVLSKRSRPRCCTQERLRISRFQSTAAAFAQSIPDDPQLPSRPTLSEDYLRKLPSPPPSIASSSARLAALHARLSLSSRLPIETLARCLVDRTADPDPSFNNSSFAVLGNDLLGYYTAEAILCRYPRLPMAIIFSAMWAYCGPKTLAAITHEWGVEAAAEPGGELDPGFLQWRRFIAGNSDIEDSGRLVKDEFNEAINGDAATQPKEKKRYESGLSSRTVSEDYFGEVYGRTAIDYLERPELLPKDGQGRPLIATSLEFASTSFVRAVMGAVYLHGGRRQAKAFFQAHFLSRKLDIASLFVFRQPTRDLSRLCAREGFESPVARVLSETGRLSRHPAFIVGVFSGKDKLGEGSGGSLDEARIRASINALKGWYLYSPLEVRVPSDTEDGSVSKHWTPVLIDGGEVVV